MTQNEPTPAVCPEILGQSIVLLISIHNQLRGINKMKNIRVHDVVTLSRLSKHLS